MQSYATSILGMLLLLNTCAENDHYRKDGAHQKNVGSLMKFKKDCGNMINKVNIISF